MTSRYNLTQQTVVNSDAQEFFLSDTEDNATEAITKIYFNIGSTTAASLSDFISNTQFDAGLSVEWRSTTDSPLDPAQDGSALVGGFYLTAAASPGTFFNSIDMAGVSLVTMSPFYAAGVDLGLSGYFETEAGALISFAPQQPAGPTYTHIGNTSGTSGIDTSTTNYDASTGVVTFDASASGALTVDATTLYVDNGDVADGSGDKTMGVYLDLGLGLASALIPSDNTVTAPAAAKIVYSNAVETILDGSVSDVTTLPWDITLTAYDDIFIGRDAQYDSATQTYDPGVELIRASDGADVIDGGGGYNVAHFGAFTNGMTFKMTSGAVTLDGEDQQWYGFQEVIGTTGYDYIYGTGDEDNSVPEQTFSLDLGADASGYGQITNSNGSNVMLSTAGGGSFYGNGGSDIIILNDVAGTTAYTYANGGSGADIIAFGLGADGVYGGGYEYTGAYSSGSSSGSSGAEEAADDLYNEGATYAMWEVDANTPKPQGTVSFTDGANTIFSMTLAAPSASWSAFVAEANKAINLQLENLEDNAGVISVAAGKTAYQYVELVTESVYDYQTAQYVDVETGIKLYFAEGITAPAIAGYYNPSLDGPQDPSGTPAGAPSMLIDTSASGGSVETQTAHMFAPSKQFIEGTGDDDDVFTAYELGYPGQINQDINQGVEALDGDTIYDLDIGQNSLSLRADRGESIYFEKGAINQAATQISVVKGTQIAGYNTVADTSDDVYEYNATVTLKDNAATPNEVSFTLDGLNGPTAALMGDQTYKLVAVWEDVIYAASGIDLGVGNTYTDASKTEVSQLTFEWQARGELVGSDSSETLTGSNETNLFQAYGGDDVLNGAGGGDAYQFTGAFGNDKVFDFGQSGYMDDKGTAADLTDDVWVEQNDMLQIGASQQHVWLERIGRRGDELFITVDDTSTGGTNVGTISIGRQYNPYTDLASVEEIHFGFTGDSSAASYSLGNGMYGGDIKVLKDGAEEFHVHGDDDTMIYMNANEGAATVSMMYAHEVKHYTWDYAANGGQGGDVFSYGQKTYGFEVDYGTHEDLLEVEIDINADGSYATNATGALHSLLSKHGVSFDTTGELHGLTVTPDAGGAYQFMDGTTLLFALEYIDASTYA